MTYVVQLEQFEGPLDLLLHLIQNARLSVRDVAVSLITQQYLAAMEGLASVDMEAASAFLATAAQLLQIKSRALLPNQNAYLAEEDSAEEDLIRRLEEYQMYKNVSAHLRTMEENALFLHTRLPEELVPQTMPVLESKNVDALFRAFLRIYSRFSETPQQEQPLTVARDGFDLAATMRKVVAFVQTSRGLLLSALFLAAETREQLVEYFICILELIKNATLGIAPAQEDGEDVWIYLTTQA